MKKVLSFVLVVAMLLSSTLLFSSCALFGEATYSFEKVECKVFYDGKDVTNDLPDELEEQMGTTDEEFKAEKEAACSLLAEDIKDHQLVLDSNTIYPTDNPEELITLKRDGSRLIPYSKDSDEPLYDESSGNYIYFLKSLTKLTIVMVYESKPTEDHTLRTEFHLTYKTPLFPKIEVKIGD